MAKSKSRLTRGEEWAEEHVAAIWTNLQTNHLWQRMLKNTLATTLTCILAMFPAVIEAYGKAFYLASIASVFGHPGRRFGQLAEALTLVLSGTLLGMAWSALGIYLSSLVYDNNPAAAYTIKGVFLAVAIFFHGFVRSLSPRLFQLVVLFMIVCTVSLTGTSTTVSVDQVTVILYPILTAVPLLLLINICIFPEFSGSFLGITTIETLEDTVQAIRDAGVYFLSVTQQPVSEQDNEKEKEKDDSAESQPPPREDESPTSDDDSVLPFFSRLARIFKSTDTPKVAPPESQAPKVLKLSEVTDKKPKLRAKLASCKSALQECMFELAFAVLPPRDLKPISKVAMKKLVANTIALIGACESKYALLGDETEEDESQIQRVAKAANVTLSEDLADASTQVELRSRDAVELIENELRQDKGSAGRQEEESEDEKDEKGKKTSKLKTRLERELKDLELIKPRKEIEFGNVELLKYLVTKIANPLGNLQKEIDNSSNVLTSCLAYCYDVPKLPSGALPPKGIELEEVDIHIESLKASITEFDLASTEALESAASIHDIQGEPVDVMPRMETFLISNFILNLRQAALTALEMLEYSRELVEKRQNRHGRRRIYAPQIEWKKWLVSGADQDILVLPESGRKDARTGTMKIDDDEKSTSGSKTDIVLKKSKTIVDEEEGIPKAKDQIQSPPITMLAHKDSKEPKPKTKLESLRSVSADIIESIAASDHVFYATRMVVAAMLITWPAFIASWNEWYYLSRGLWATIQLILVSEVSIGTAVNIFIIRAIGTSIGCAWGFAAFVADDGNKVIIIIMLVIGIIPSTYVQLGTSQTRVGMVLIISMCIVSLSTVVQTVPGSAVENFLKRLISFLIGGVAAVAVELVLFPVRARTRLVESLASSIRQISEMEACLAYGIETEINVSANSSEVTERFEAAKSKAEGALAAAETFLPFCMKEPRLKGSFAGLALVYGEILYVLHQITDKMDNMLQLRREYGSGVLEELNAQVFQYRRNVAGSVTLILFAVHEALTTKLPLPQFLPSARLAHLRLVNRVREVVLAKSALNAGSDADSDPHQLEQSILKRIVRQKYLSWNAASAGQIEVIEYLEELIDLTKLLVGANEFRSGMLTRPTYREYVQRIGRASANYADRTGTAEEGEQDELRDVITEPAKLGLTKRRIYSSTVDTKRDAHLLSKKVSQAEEDNLPMSLQRVRSRRVEGNIEKLEKVRSKAGYDDRWTKKE